jgi:predicted RecB family nuclease
MLAGSDVIYQGVLVEDDWRGISDFLIRTETPSRLGSWSYEAWDTKLARHSKPYFVLQLCFYSGQLGRLQGIDLAQMHVILRYRGSGSSPLRGFRGVLSRCPPDISPRNRQRSAHVSLSRLALHVL